ncbi:MAG: DUF4177 domain-containing protein [Actinomycetota bacterium]|nr:DUF4177 domain-containing protein [Actinomycetota bacterium]
MLSGAFPPEKLEKVLNEHAAEGWKLVSSYQAQNIWKSPKGKIVLILERTT